MGFFVDGLSDHAPTKICMSAQLKQSQRNPVPAFVSKSAVFKQYAAVLVEAANLEQFSSFERLEMHTHILHELRAGHVATHNALCMQYMMRAYTCRPRFTCDANTLADHASCNYKLQIETRTAAAIKEVRAMLLGSALGSPSYGEA